MTASLPLLLTLTLAAPDVGVALTKRSGASKPVATARATLVREQLERTGEVVDLTSCQRRLPCLLKAARERKWVALVTVETANVLTDAIVDVRLLSVEEDGRELARGNVQIAEAGLAAALPANLEGVKRALATLLSPPPPVAPALAQPEPRVEAPPPPPPLVVTAREPAAATQRPSARWIPLGVSLAITAAGGVCLGASESVATRLRTDTLGQTAIDDLVASGKTLRTLGVTGLVAGGALSAASLVLALLWPEPRLAPSAFWVPGGAGVAIGGYLP